MTGCQLRYGNGRYGLHHGQVSMRCQAVLTVAEIIMLGPDGRVTFPTVLRSHSYILLWAFEVDDHYHIREWRRRDQRSQINYNGVSTST